MSESTTRNEVIAILQDALLEVETTLQDLDFGDPVIESLESILGMLDIAVEMLEGEL